MFLSLSLEFRVLSNYPFLYIQVDTKSELRTHPLGALFFRFFFRIHSLHFQTLRTFLVLLLLFRVNTVHFHTFRDSHTNKKHMIGASGKLLSTSAKPVLNEMIPAIETGITTSKALSILVTSPSELEKQEDLLVAAAEELNGLPTVDEKKGQAPSKLMSIHELAELPKNEATSATSAVLVHKPLEANAPRDAVLHSDSIAKDLDTQKTEVSLTVPQEQNLESGSIMETDSTEKNTIDDLNTVETQDTEEISPEEHEAVRKSTKFINMKELLQLTFQKLLEDDYLLSIPVSVPARRVTMDGEVKDWVSTGSLYLNLPRPPENYTNPLPIIDPMERPRTSFKSRTCSRPH